MRICLIGLGKVGRELIRQTWNNPVYTYIAISDTSGIVTKYSGFTHQDLVDIVSLKEKGGKLIEYDKGHTQITDNMRNVFENKANVVVDVSNHQTYEMLDMALDYKIHVIGSNKLPYADVSSEDFDKLSSKAKQKRLVLDNRTVVSANLGVLIRLKEFTNTAGGVSYIRGGLSGTMAYISWRMSQGVKFSQAVYEAIEKGYTETDFRTDLKGSDSARKAVVMARTNGYSLELADVNIEKLITPELEQANIEDAAKLLPILDKIMKSRVDAAAEKNCSLRYVGELDFDKKTFRVGFDEIPLSDPQSSTRGSWNKVTMLPRYWNGEPLTIEGPGAGINVTTQGLMAGLHEIASNNSIHQLVQ